MKSRLDEDGQAPGSHSIGNYRDGLDDIVQNSINTIFHGHTIEGETIKPHDMVLEIIDNASLAKNSLNINFPNLMGNVCKYVFSDIEKNTKEELSESEKGWVFHWIMEGTRHITKRTVSFLGDAMVIRELSNKEEEFDELQKKHSLSKLLGFNLSEEEKDYEMSSGFSKVLMEWIKPLDHEVKQDIMYALQARALGAQAPPKELLKSKQGRAADLPESKIFNAPRGEA